MTLPFASLRAKLLVSFSTFIVLAICVSATSFWFYQKRERLASIDNALDHIHLQTLQAIKAEYDFFSIDQIKSDFYKTGQSNYLNEHRLHVTQLKQLLDSLNNAEDAQNFGIREDIFMLSTQLARYDSTFKQAVASIRIRGFDGYGLEGKRQLLLHRLEYQPSLEPHHLVWLHNYEKEYTHARSIRSVARLDSIQTAWKKVYAQNGKQSVAHAQTYSLLMQYVATVNNLAALEKAIGQNSESGMKKQLRAVTDRIEYLTERMTGKANIQAKQTKELLSYVFAGIILLVAAGSFWFSYTIANAITRPIINLSIGMDRLIKSSFTDNQAALSYNKPNEVGKLTQNFNLMVAQIEQHLGEIDKKSKALETQNAELSVINQKLIESEHNLIKLNSVKDKFFSIISHDLKGPLNTLTGFLHILQSYTDTFTKDELRHFAYSMDESVKRLLSLLDNLLQWSLSQTGSITYQPSWLNIGGMISFTFELFKEMAAVKRIELTAQVDENTLVWADQNMLNFVLRNLISNAIKFTHPGGKITITTIVREEQVQIQVTDNGIGISEEDIAKLFQSHIHHSTPGTQLEKGTGFGLLLCKEFVERNGGKIVVQSKLGEGTTIIFNLPATIHEQVPA
jgi:signal transduction histidine kinase